MNTRREEFYFNSAEGLNYYFPLDNTDVWITAGSPRLWVRTHEFYYYDKDSIVVWSDHAYGGIRLIVNGEDQIGRDIVQNGKYVAMSATYSNGEDDFQDVKVLKTIAVK